MWFLLISTVHLGVQFVTLSFGAKPNYGGYDYEQWTPRNMNEHREKAMQCKLAPTSSEQRKILQESGVKYSSIIETRIEIDVIPCHFVDPMHCLFLGLAKEKKVIQPCDFKVLQERADKNTPPSKVGLIPRKIESGFASFTADEWKN